ncbi:hypothetical protein P170DRAFT_504814 [Aspergillus steynii IBT 23096]|uniref:Glycoside hydrolase n=1 Tax=Aspergillus steynii IBT 23096 TaxID=1392250 RepID=A0A2I2GM44_9EURO|nr:uncharacterized protein P170DRAFT_504814 [Aspergillus steynii IBT 23096]PLB53945.1 hypothetical protein P170DRAFT_504814 [Aspergillus steynii IBT 23096]
MQFLLAIAALAGSGIISVAQAQSVFAHYMIGETNPDHAKQDVEDAKSVGFDAFAMNVGDPTAEWAQNCVKALFDGAEGTDFNLFFSFDMYQHPDLQGHIDLFNKYSDHPNYMRAGSDNNPVVSSFGGSGEADAWSSFKQNSDIYLIPNLDDSDSSKYFENPEEKLSQFNDFVDGYFSWESAWPGSTGSPVNVSSEGDQKVMEYAHGSNKGYMMPLSPIQYKNTGDGHWYRIGEVNLPQRMTQILDLKPDFTEFITWNDGGESHYIGNLWSESYTTVPEIVEYANTDKFPHFAWQPLIGSFIRAFKDGKSADGMETGSESPIGAMWYRGMTKSCSDQPSNADAARDTVNYAVVLPPLWEGITIRVSSGGNVLTTSPASPGLNYAAVEGMVGGQQKIEVLGKDESVMFSATSGDDVTDGGKCNFNFHVVELSKP